MKFEDLFVKQTEKSDKKSDKGPLTTYKVQLQQSGDDFPKVTIVNDEPIELKQGEKALVLDIKSDQTKLK